MALCQCVLATPTHTMPHLIRSSSDVEASVLLLGTGETLKRSAVDSQAPPPKPPRTNSVADLLEEVKQESNVGLEGGVNNEKEGGVKENNEGGVREESEGGGVNNEKEGGVKEEKNEGGVKEENKEGGVERADTPIDNVEEDEVKQLIENNSVNEVEREIEGSRVKQDGSTHINNAATLSSQPDRNNSTTTNECTSIDTNTTDPVTHDNAIFNQSNQCDNNKPEVITQSPLTGEPRPLISGCG